MQSISSLASGVSKAVWGESTPQQQSGEEPISGETGEGTADKPYDAGNEPEQAEMNETRAPAPTVTTTEPAAEPAAEPVAEPTTTTEASPDRPGQNARMPSFATKVTSNTPALDAGPTDESQMAAAGKPLAEPASDSAVHDNATSAAATAPVKKAEAPNPFDAANDSSAPPSQASRLRVDSADRSVSPGARPDGSHAETGKVEKTKFSTKLKEKLKMGKQ